MGFVLHLLLFQQKIKETSFLALWVTVMLLYPEFILSDVMTLFTNMKLSSSNAATLVNVRDALTSMFGIVGAIVVDMYLTNHGMIFFSSLFYLGGLILLMIKSLDDLSVGIGLVLIAVGNSSLINSSNDLASEENRSPILVNSSKYAAQIIVVLVSFVPILVYTADSSQTADYDYKEVTFNFTFLASAILVLLVPPVALFYRIKKKKSFRKQIGNRGTPLKHLPRVFIAAILKRRLSLGTPNDLYEEDNPRHPLGHTNGRLRFLDKAAIKEPLHPGEERSKWICTITQVEECKRLLRMVPICTTFLAYGMVKSIGNTFFLEQANQMNTKMGAGEFPPAAFLYLAELSASLTKRLYIKLIADELKEAGTKYVPTIEYGMGMVLSTLCCVVASWVITEIYSHPISDTESNSTLSVFWLTPQFVIFGAMNGLATEGIEGFYSGQLPPSMKRYASVFAEALIGVGSLFATLLVFLAQVAFNWGPHKNFNMFYLLLTVVEITIFFIYSFFAVRYRYEGDNTTEVHVQTEVPGANEQASDHHVIIDVENVPPAENFTDTEVEQLTPEEPDDELRELIQPADSTRRVGLTKRFNRLWTF